MRLLITTVLTALLFASAVVSKVVAHADLETVNNLNLPIYGGSKVHVRDAPIVDLGLAVPHADQHDNNNDYVPGMTLTITKTPVATLLPIPRPSNAASGLKVPRILLAPALAFKMIVSLPRVTVALVVPDSGATASDTNGIGLNNDAPPGPPALESVTLTSLNELVAAKADTSDWCCFENECYLCDTTPPIFIEDREIKSTTTISLSNHPISAGSNLRAPRVFVALKLLSSPSRALAQFLAQRCSDCNDPVCVAASNSICPRPIVNRNGTDPSISSASSLRLPFAFTLLLSGAKKALAVTVPMQQHLRNSLSAPGGLGRFYEEDAVGSVVSVSSGGGGGAERFPAAETQERLQYNFFDPQSLRSKSKTTSSAATAAAAAGWEGRLRAAWGGVVLVALFFAWNLS